MDAPSAFAAGPHALLCLTAPPPPLIAAASAFVPRALVVGWAGCAGGEGTGSVHGVDLRAGDSARFLGKRECPTTTKWYFSRFE